MWTFAVAFTWAHLADVAVFAGECLPGNASAGGDEGSNGRVRLRVEDDGRGFDPNVASQNEAPSWGLKIMRERIESIGGKVQIESEPGEGTRVIFEIERPS